MRKRSLSRDKGRVRRVLLHSLNPETSSPHTHRGAPPSLCHRGGTCAGQTRAKNRFAQSLGHRRKRALPRDKGLVRRVLLHRLKHETSSPHTHRGDPPSICHRGGTCVGQTGAKNRFVLHEMTKMRLTRAEVPSGHPNHLRWYVSDLVTGERIVRQTGKKKVRL